VVSGDVVGATVVVVVASSTVVGGDVVSTTAIVVATVVAGRDGTVTGDWATNGGRYAVEGTVTTAVVVVASAIVVEVVVVVVVVVVVGGGGMSVQCAIDVSACTIGVSGSKALGPPVVTS
jgi:hypothetical protein